MLQNHLPEELGSRVAEVFALHIESFRYPLGSGSHKDCIAKRDDLILRLGEQEKSFARVVCVQMGRLAGMPGPR
jgi:hypothetical protein